MVKKIVYFILSVVLSTGLIVSIPLITIFIKDGFSTEKKKMIRKTEVKRIVLTPKQQEKKEMRRRPRRRLSPRTSQSSGPRFAMSLGAQGMDGVGIGLDMLTSGSSSSDAENDGVDERPELSGDLQVAIPEAIRRAEVNASVRLLFCVDIAGRPYDIRVSEEEPQGLGLAQAGREALSRAMFSPAMRNGQAVPFCGMEQPIEIKFRN
jgi:hypothetical protein